MWYSLFLFGYGSGIGLLGFIFMCRCWQRGSIPRRFGKRLMRDEEPLSFQYSILLGCLISGTLFAVCTKLLLEVLDSL